MKRNHAPFMIFIFAALLFGLWAGLIRNGWQLPNPHDNFALTHGVLMVGGFMGTLINLERAVALHAFLKSPTLRMIPYLAPLFSILSVIALVFDLSLAALLMTLSSIGMVLMFAYIVMKQTAPYTMIMALGAGGWLVGNLIWLNGEPLFRSAPWWMTFLVLTIAGERLELTRVMRHARYTIYLLTTIVGILLIGLLLTRADYGLGMRVVGLGNIGIALWLLRYDVVRRTIRKSGLPRFIAVCLGVGYVWLAISGLIGLYYGGVKAGMIYDAVLHAVFLGFAFSMIFGHAPIILPAVLRIDLAYSPLFYLHLTLLHTSLVLRVGGDLTAWQAGRHWGALLNALVLLFFIGNMARAVRIENAPRLIPHGKILFGSYVLALVLILLAFMLIEGDIISTSGSESDSSNRALIQGKELYQSNCATCHGVNGQGITGIGKDLVDSEFVDEQSDAELRDFIIQGRPAWDPANTTDIAMPPRGGNPALTDDDIHNIILYIRSLD